jgi:hypothetical protein
MSESQNFIRKMCIFLFPTTNGFLRTDEIILDLLTNILYCILTHRQHTCSSTHFFMKLVEQLGWAAVDQTDITNEVYTCLRTSAYIQSTFSHFNYVSQLYVFISLLLTFLHAASILYRRNNICLIHIMRLVTQFSPLSWVQIFYSSLGFNTIKSQSPPRQDAKTIQNGGSMPHSFSRTRGPPDYIAVSLSELHNHILKITLTYSLLL